MAVPIQQQIKKIWQQQSNTQRLVLITLVIAAAILIPVLISWANTPSFSVAFSGMSETDAGQIMQKLEEANIDYQLRGTDTILVPSNEVYAVRLQMANAGLPSTGTVGFELFSGNTLGMTDFTQRVNYQRALEGELERTIGSLSTVESVRVHLVTPEKTLLEADQQPTTASVTVKQRNGSSLDSAQVDSITRLVASSVEGLKAENVTVVDTDGNLLSSGEGSADGAGLARSDNRRAAEQAAANEIQKKVQGLLDSVLGPNNSVVKASVAMDWTQREVTSKAINPTESAIISSQKSNEKYTTKGGSSGGVPGATSNLPTPKATTASGGSTTDYARTDETFNYEVSQTESHEIFAPGQIKSVSLSVLVDGELDNAKLKTLKSAVSAAAGIDEKRGDKLVVDRMAFDHTSDTAAVADEMTKAEQTDLYIRYGVYGAAALLSLLLLWYIMRLFRNLKLATSDTWITVMKPVNELAPAAATAGALGGGPATALPMSSFPTETSSLPGAISAAMSGSSFPSPETSPAPEPYHAPEPSRAPVAYPEDEQRQRVISRLTEENPASVAEIIQMWLSEDEKRNG